MLQSWHSQPTTVHRDSTMAQVRLLTYLLTYLLQHLHSKFLYPGTRSSSTARCAMCVAAFCITDDKPRFELNRLCNRACRQRYCFTTECKQSNFLSIWSDRGVAKGPWSPNHGLSGFFNGKKTGFVGT